MSDAPVDAVSCDEPRHLLPYGVGGDYIGARRARRAFRLTVMACLGITASLYFSEHWLRYGLSEVQYRTALTLEDDSQRVFLRNVVKRDGEESIVPTPRYVAALAYIEEDDLILERYAEAIALAPEDGSLLILYGCQLFKRGDFKEARRIFREAGLKWNKNSLPEYLQAAAIAASSTSEEDFRTAVAMVVRTNDSGEPLVFPQPYWHESLPQQGYWYGKQRSEMIDKCCAPLYSLKNIILKRAHKELRERASQSAEGWLYPLQVLGSVLVGKSSTPTEQLSASAAIAGLKLQLDAIALRSQFLEKKSTVSDVNLPELSTTLQRAFDRIVAFEESREQSLDVRKAAARVPIYMALRGVALLGFASLVFVVLNRIAHTDKNARALRQTRVGMEILAGWSGALALCLLLVVLVPGGGLLYFVGSWIWTLLLLAIVVVASVYPARVLPTPLSVCRGYLSEPSYRDVLQQARRCRTKAYLSLAGRFMNIALGCYLCLLSCYLIVFRIFSGLYPTDIKLLVSGLTTEEFALIREIQGWF